MTTKLTSENITQDITINKLHTTGEVFAGSTRSTFLFHDASEVARDEEIFSKMTIMRVSTRSRSKPCRRLGRLLMRHSDRIDSTTMHHHQEQSLSRKSWSDLFKKVASGRRSIDCRSKGHIMHVYMATTTHIHE